MSDAWDADDFEPVPMGQAPASWDEEEEETEVATRQDAVAKPARASKLTTSSKPQESTVRKQPTTDLPVDPLKRRIAEREAVERADFELTKDLFGLGDLKVEDEQETTKHTSEWEEPAVSLAQEQVQPTVEQMIVYDPRKKPDGPEGATAFAERMRDCIWMYRQQQPKNASKLFWELVVEATAPLTDQEMSTMAKYVATYKKKREKGEKGVEEKKPSATAPKVAKAVMKKKGKAAKGSKKFDEKPARDDDFDFL